MISHKNLRGNKYQSIAYTNKCMVRFNQTGSIVIFLLRKYIKNPIVENDSFLYLCFVYVAGAGLLCVSMSSAVQHL